MDEIGGNKMSNNEENRQEKTIATQPWVIQYINDLFFKVGVEGIIFKDQSETDKKKELYIDNDTIFTIERDESELSSRKKEEKNNKKKGDEDNA